MKKHLITGLVILLPLALTIFIVLSIFNLLTDPFVGVVKGVLNYFGVFRGGFFFLSADETQQAVSKLFILIFLFAFTLLLGALARWYLIRYMLKVWDVALHKIPFVRSVYRVSQDVINTIFSNKASSFKQVVMVPFPHQKSHSIGFIIKDDFPALQDLRGTPLVAVFVPTTPNPTSGFLLAMEEKDIVYLDMKVEEAFKFIVSCGVIESPFNSISKAQSAALSEMRLKESDIEKKWS